MTTTMPLCPCGVLRLRPGERRCAECVLIASLQRGAKQADRLDDGIDWEAAIFDRDDAEDRS